MNFCGKILQASTPPSGVEVSKHKSLCIHPLVIQQLKVLQSLQTIYCEGTKAHQGLLVSEITTSNGAKLRNFL